MRTGIHTAAEPGVGRLTKYSGLILMLALFATTARAQGWLPGTGPAPVPHATVIGPYNAEFPAGGDELLKPVPGYADGARLDFAPAWTLECWVRAERVNPGRVLVASVGGPGDADARSIALVDGRPAVVVGTRVVEGGRSVLPGRWVHIAATATDGRLRLFVNGRAVSAAALPDQASPGAIVNLGPRRPNARPFAGRLAGFLALPRALPACVIAMDAATSPKEELTTFENGSPTWPLQVRTQYGQAAPQPAWTLPRRLSPPARPTSIPPSRRPALEPVSESRLLVNGWRMAEERTVAADAATLSQPGFDAANWYVATVPGTVLTTLVDRGVYPDPRIGLNNLAIPDRLARQDYWYRTEFMLPAKLEGRRLNLLLDGINYAAELWVNGDRIGKVKGAFIRGQFDLTGRLRPGRINAVAVRVSPPPHPGIPHEQSIAGGRGENGGAMMIDGPTFGATEGWDWIPGVRDRNTGLWQGVTLLVTNALALGDPQIVTTLPREDDSVADIEIGVPVTNHGGSPLTATVAAAFDDVKVEKRLSVPAGATLTAVFRSAEFPELLVRHPRLWWPNGYGDPALHALHLSVASGYVSSDTRDLRLGMRQVTYELSAMDAHGDLDRIEVDFARARALRAEIIDERHAALRKVPGGWVPSLFPGAERSPAVRMLPPDPGLSPQMVLRVNGVRIAVRGGNMGMDEMMKRVERARLAPYFRLQREAHMNMRRNWMGQSTEEVLYDLADENGIMIFNDFWESTQDNDAEAEDVPLFIANARDVVRRFRNHPSIVLWNGRNEGVPQPILQAALQDMTREEDGTRLYTGNSRLINFGGSGPYNWREPSTYFTEHARGFAVEVGTLSFPTIEAWSRFVPAADRWPINDTWAYHDWHQERAVSSKTFMDALAIRFGEATNLVDFERKAQMLEYESHRAIFEGFNAGLWKTNSARMLWMSHPAWPSADFQIYSTDYDTHGAYYGAKKGAEPFHVQINLPDHDLLLVNTTLKSWKGVRVTVRVVTLDGRPLLKMERIVDALANSTISAGPLAIDSALVAGPVLIRLEAHDGAGALLADNFYWQAATPAALRALNTMPPAALTITTRWQPEGDATVVQILLANDGKWPALAAKLTAFDAQGVQVLPAYFSAIIIFRFCPAKSASWSCAPTPANAAPLSGCVAGMCLKLRLSSPVHNAAAMEETGNRRRGSGIEMFLPESV